MDNSARMTERIRKVLMQLPEVCFDFFMDIEPRTTLLTRLNYAYDLKTFMTYMQENVLTDVNSPADMTLDDLKKITARDISMYLEYLNAYSRNVVTHKEDGTEITRRTQRSNDNTGKKRKLVAVRVFFKYLYKHKLIPSDPAELVEVPKIREKAIIHMDNGEVDRLFDTLDHPNRGFTDHQAAYAETTKERDTAIITLLLGTGIRVSECAGINMNDIDWDLNRFKITRKGGNEAILYFNDEVKAALETYRSLRKTINAVPGHEQAFFLSLQRKRMSQRSIEVMVKKYAQASATVKKITPHKLRSTFGTELYRNTGDIYLVADVLGHKDVNVTRKHYADMSEDKRKMAAELTNLRRSESAPEGASSPDNEKDNA